MVNFEALPDDIVEYILGFLFFSHSAIVGPGCCWFNGTVATRLRSEVGTFTSVSRVNRTLRRVCDPFSFVHRAYNHYSRLLDSMHCVSRYSVPVDIFGRLKNNGCPWLRLSDCARDMVSCERYIVSFYSNTSVVKYQKHDVVCYLVVLATSNPTTDYTRHRCHEVGTRYQ